MIGIISSTTSVPSWWRTQGQIVTSRVQVGFTLIAHVCGHHEHVAPVYGCITRVVGFAMPPHLDAKPGRWRSTSIAACTERRRSRMTGRSHHARHVPRPPPMPAPCQPHPHPYVAEPSQQPCLRAWGRPSRATTRRAPPRSSRATFSRCAPAAAARHVPRQHGGPARVFSCLCMKRGGACRPPHVCGRTAARAQHHVRCPAIQ